VQYHRVTLTQIYIIYNTISTLVLAGFVTGFFWTTGGGADELSSSESITILKTMEANKLTINVHNILGDNANSTNII